MLRLQTVVMWCGFRPQVLALQGETAEAIRTLKSALKLEPSNKVMQNRYKNVVYYF